MLRLAGLLALAATLGLAQSGLEVPRLGFVRDSGNRVRPLYGIAGNFVVGQALVEGAISVASSDRWGLAKLERQVILLDTGGLVRARWEAPDGEALFAFTAAGEPALAYFSRTGELFRITRDALAPLGICAEPVLAVGVQDGERATLIVRREQGLALRRMHLATGEIEQETLVAPEAELAMLMPGGLTIYTRGAELCMQDGASRRCVPLPAAAEAFNQLNGRWVEIILTGAAGRMALRVDEETPALYRLPEIKQ